MISYSIYVTPKDNYISITMSDEKRLVVVSSYLPEARLIEDDKETKYIKVSHKRFNKLKQKVVRKVLCTL